MNLRGRMSISPHCPPQIYFITCNFKRIHIVHHVQWGNGWMLTVYTILSTSNRIPTRGQQRKTQLCLLPVNSCRGTTIVMSDCTIVTSEQHLYQTIVQFDKTILLPRKLATGNIHDYLFCYCPLVCILFEVLIHFDQLHNLSDQLFQKCYQLHQIL